MPKKCCFDKNKKKNTFLTFLDKMQFSAIVCLENYDWFCADRSHLFNSVYSPPLHWDAIPPSPKRGTFDISISYFYKHSTCYSPVGRFLVQEGVPILSAAESKYMCEQ